MDRGEALVSSRLAEWLRGLPPLVVDGGLAVAALVAQLAPFVSADRPSGQPWPVAGYLVAVGVSAPVVLRQRFPFAVLMASELAAAAYSSSRVVPTMSSTAHRAR